MAAYNLQRINMKSTDFQAMDEYILVKPDSLNNEEKTESGIVFAINKESAVVRPTSGTVLTTGSEVKNVKDGNFVLWPTTDGIDFEFDDGEFVLLREKSIIGKRK